MGDAMTKPLRALAALLLYGVVLAAVYCVHVRYLRVDVVFYGALLDAAIAVPLSWGLLRLLRVLTPFNGFEKLQLAAIGLLCGYVFAISIPTVIDRSLSFYLLEKLQQRGGGIRLDRFEGVVAQEYLREQRVADVRLTEQLKSGTIAIADGCVRLTARGARLARFSRFFRAHLLPRQRLVGGRYSDALTDPFRHSGAQADYACAASADRDAAL